MRTVFYDSDELYDSSNTCLRTLGNCVDDLNEMKNRCQKDIEVCSDVIRQTQEASTSANQVSEEISAKMSEIKIEIDKVNEELASLEPPHEETVVFDDGSSAEVLVDPDAVRRAQLEGELEILENKCNTLEMLAGELEQCIYLIEESKDRMQKYPTKLEECSSSLSAKINDMEYATNEILRARANASIIFDRMTTVKFAHPVPTPFDNSYISTSRTSGQVDTENFEGLVDKFKKNTNNMLQDCEILRKYIQSITDWDDKLRVEAEKILSDIQNIVEKFILVSMQDCFKNLDVLNECYKDYEYLNNSLNF